MFRLSELAGLLSGRLEGNDIEVSGVSTPDEQVENTVCIIASKKMLRYMNGKASAYILPEDLFEETVFPVVYVKNTRYALVELINIFMPEPETASSVSEKASLASCTKLGKDVSIGDFVVTGVDVSIGDLSVIHPCVTIGNNVKIGAGCIIYPGVVLYAGTIVRDNVIIHAGAKIGGDGFGYIPGEKHMKIPHRGCVILEDNVEIGCNTTIDRGTLTPTVIGSGTKIDNLVQIGHNVKTGRGCLIASQCGISGSTVLGDYVTMGGQVGLADHIKIGSFVSIAAKSGVHSDIKDNQAYGGIPAVPVLEWARAVAAAGKLSELRKKVHAMEKKLEGK